MVDLFLALFLTLNLFAAEPVSSLRPSSSSIAASTVSQKQLLHIFNYLSAQKQIPFDFPNRGCEARAHAMSLLLKKMSIQSGKIFALGNLRFKTEKSANGYVDWRFHVAIFLRLKNTNNMTEDFVIDPSMFDRPVSVKEWLSKQLEHPTAKLDRLFYTPNEVYNLDFNENYTKLNIIPANLEDMQYSLSTYLEAQNNLK